MKKYVAFILVIAMILGSFTACGTKDNDNTKEDESSNITEQPSSEQTKDNTKDDKEEETKPYKIAIIQHVEHPSLNLIRETIISELEALGYGEDKVEIIVQNANGDMTMLPTIMQNMIGDGVDMLVPIATPTAQTAMAATNNGANCFFSSK